MKIIRDPLWKNIEVSDVCSAILETEPFQRLNDIKQLGPTYLVYPGATHTRFSHSLGVYDISKRLMEKLLQKTNENFDPAFFSKTDIASFEVAALCHDLGHFPFTHALKELPLLDHEVLTGLIITQSKIADILKRYDIDSNFVASIINTEIETCNPKVIFFRKILSGVLDPDKLDYLNRDAFYCGVPYGIQDTQFTLSSIYPDIERGIYINSKSIVSVENLLFSKYLMYRTVYWHKDVRIATAMMKKSLYAALNSSEITDNDLYSLTDSQLFGFGKNKNTDVWFCRDKLNEKKLYNTLIEKPFSIANEKHKKLENLEKRTNTEIEIARQIGCTQNQILIDIPENISFESNLFIKDENCTFSQSSTVFNNETVKSFTEKLRKIRVAVDKDFISKKTDNEICKITKLIEEFI